MAYHDKDLRAAGEEGRSRLHDRVPAPEAEAPAEISTIAENVPAKPKSGRAKRFVVLAVLAAIFAFGGYEGPHWWQTGRFMISTDDAYVQADITILSAKVSGYVSSLAVGHNQSVKAGDLIATIDDGDYRLARQSAMDKLATQQSAIVRIGRQIEAEKAAVAKAEAQIAAAQADAQQAASDFARQQQLAKSDYASKATFETAQAARDRANANVKSAEASLVAARPKSRFWSAQQVEAERVAAELQTAVAKAERDLSFTEIRAPVDGVVGNKAVEVGTYVQPGTRLAAIVPLASVHVDANFKETQLAAVKPGQTVISGWMLFPDAISAAWSKAWRRHPARCSACCRLRTRPVTSPRSFSASRSASRWTPMWRSRICSGRACRWWSTSIPARLPPVQDRPALGRDHGRQRRHHRKAWRAAGRTIARAGTAENLRVHLHGLRHVHGDPRHPDRLRVACRNSGRAFGVRRRDLLGPDKLPDRRSDHDSAFGHPVADLVDAVDVRDLRRRLHAHERHVRDLHVDRAR